MNYGEIKKTDIANGPGVRVSLFVSGCTHQCKNCFNEVAWDFGYGRQFTRETADELYEALSPEYISGLTILGGEPFEPQNQRALLPFIKEVRRRFPSKSIWVFSGYLFEELKSDSRARCDVTDEILSLIDVLVDGEFIEEEKDISLKFRGSANQRIIDMPKTLAVGHIVSYY